MLKRLVIFISVLTLSLLPLLSIHKVEAAAFTSISDIMSRQKATTVSNHTIAFTQNGSTQFVSGETLTITFESTFDTSGLDNTDPLDYDITIGGTEEAIVAAGCGATDEIEITSIVADVITFTACGSLTAEAAGSVIVVEIGTHTSAPSAGDTQIINATSSGSKIISLGGTIGDTGQVAVPILDEDQVTVSANVDPTITSTLDTTTCTLTPDPITTAGVSKCVVQNTIVTNAASGYGSTVLADDVLDTSGGDNIDAVSDGTVNAASEEYGISSEDTTGTADVADWDGDCTGTTSEPGSEIAKLAETPDEYANNGAPVNEQISLCHAAAISGTTPAGAYNQIVTHITTGNF